MRILQLAPIWETVPPPAYGGTEAVVHVLTEELVRRGMDVTLCASGDSITSADLFSVSPRSLRPAGLTADALQLSLVHVAKSLAKARDYDLVHVHTGPPGELAMAFSHLVDVPMLATLHNLLERQTEFIWQNYGGWYNSISRQQLSSLPELPRARFAGVVHNAIDVDSFPFQTKKDDFALFIGRMVADKAPHLAIAAARKAGVRLVIAGKVAAPEEYEYFESVIKPEIDGCSVQFVGEADATLKRELYRRARCLLVPLQWDEPFGLVMIEAMACGTPPIAFNRGAAKEIICHRETGFLVSGLDQMIDMIDRVDQIDPVACRAAVQARFSPRALADRYLAVYKKILECSHESNHTGRRAIDQGPASGGSAGERNSCS